MDFSFGFGRKGGRRAQGRAPLMWLGGIAPGEGALSYEGQVRAAYLGNAIAQRAVKVVAESVASALPVVSPAGHPAARLLATPAPGRTGTELIETLASHLLLHGNAYAAGGREGGAPAALFALRPERMSVETGGDGWPVAYVYRAGSATARFAPDELLHLKAFHPLDDHYGLGCLGAAAGAVAVHNAAAKWNRALLDNAARPSGALVAGGETLTAAQIERLRAELEAGFAGAANAGRPLLLEGGLSWQSLSLTPSELDFAATTAAAAREIALAFGVPPLLLGLPGDNTHANYAEANRALWRMTVLPMAERIAAGLQGWLRRWWPDVALTIDRDALPALSEDRARLWAQVTAADFLTADEKRVLLGVEERTGP